MMLNSNEHQLVFLCSDIIPRCIGGGDGGRGVPPHFFGTLQEKIEIL